MTMKIAIIVILFRHIDHANIYFHYSKQYIMKEDNDVNTIQNSILYGHIRGQKKYKIYM